MDTAQPEDEDRIVCGAAQGGKTFTHMAQVFGEMCLICGMEAELPAMIRPVLVSVEDEEGE